MRRRLELGEVAAARVVVEVAATRGRISTTGVRGGRQIPEASQATGGVAHSVEEKGE
jgi:hypothetical protein